MCLLLMGGLFSGSKVRPENMSKNSGHKKVKHPRKKRFDVWDVPTTLEDLVALYQEYEILPREKDGYKLKLVGPEVAKSRGDKINDGYKFQMVGKTSDPRFVSIRPVLLRNSKNHILTDFWRIYELALDTPHNIIAEKHGLVHDVFPVDGEAYKDVNYAPITRLRADVIQMVTAHAEHMYFSNPENAFGGPKEIVTLDAVSLGHKSKNGNVIFNICLSNILTNQYFG